MSRNTALELIAMTPSFACLCRASPLCTGTIGQNASRFFPGKKRQAMWRRQELAKSLRPLNAGRASHVMGGKAVRNVVRRAFPGFTYAKNHRDSSRLLGRFSETAIGRPPAAAPGQSSAPTARGGIPGWILSSHGAKKKKIRRTDVGF